MPESPMKVLELIPVDSLKVIPDEFKDIPLYKLVKPGVLKICSGVKLNHDDILVFDVTDLGQEFKDKYSMYIVKTEMETQDTLNQRTSKTK